MKSRREPFVVALRRVSAQLERIPKIREPWTQRRALTQQAEKGEAHNERIPQL